ncbi:agmatinase [Thermomonospora cellulosilytica]|uniref:Agmatinase n=1 Tax=Thermomonospora cellulosilytica TaxID=1411118 RepID=A0A7W3MZX4_9ACTN|nr:agmatinase [Thermomonospora cellulosilytica]MBA9004976.1 agmatinase [Thermomonospora cellulosilytica]
MTLHPPALPAEPHDGPEPLGPVDSSRVPRFAGPPTFARLPRLDQVRRADVGIVGVPFDTGVSYRPGARFGPAAVREASRLLRPYNPAQDVSPFQVAQVVDAGDIACNPFDIGEAVRTVQETVAEVAARCDRVVTIGGDHTIALPLLREARQRFGEPIALIHFDAHLDTWDTYFGAAYTHGTPFRRAHEEGLLAEGACAHVGTRGPLYGRIDLDDDARMGFGIVTSDDFQVRTVDDIAGELVRRVGDRPVYVSVDIDVLDPAHAPGTGTPEAGGLTSRELLGVLRRLSATQVVGADVVEVAPAYDHAQLTSVAASHTVYELVTLLAAKAWRGGSP